VTVALAALAAIVALLIAATMAFDSRRRLPRPPIGRYTFPDVLVMFAVVVLAPEFYLILPRLAVAAVFGLVMLFAVQLGLAAVAGRAAWPMSVALCAVTVVAALSGHVVATAALTDAAILIAVVAVATLWTQSGLRAGHVALFAVLLAGYDLVATVFTTVMSDLFRAVAALPFAPVFLLDRGSSPVAIGVGDLLMLVLYPLAARRSLGAAAGRIAAATGVVVTGVVVAGYGLGIIDTRIPLLTVLGPLIVVQYALTRSGRRHVTVPAEMPVSDPPSGEATGWVAVHAGRVVGVGASPGLARRAAREAGLHELPHVVDADSLRSDGIGWRDSIQTDGSLS
jgi:hypothetical protein